MDDNQIENHANKARTEMRRSDRAMPEEEIKARLVDGEYGVLATSHDGQPYATPVNYIYIEEDHSICFHGAHSGRARANLALNPRVCFNVSRMGALTTAQKSSGFGADYRSVTVFGRAEKLTDEDQIIKVFLALMHKYFPDHQPGADYPIPTKDEIRRTAVYRITIEEWSGKQRG